MFTAWEQWREWHSRGEFTVLPIVTRIAEPLISGSQIVSWEHVLAKASPYAVVLESGKGGDYTYLGTDPDRVIVGTAQEAVSWDLLQGSKLNEHHWQGGPLVTVRQWMADRYGPRLADGDLPDFIGGCAGFWGYDVVRAIERLPVLAEADLGLPDYAFVQLNELWAIDHTSGYVYAIVQSPVSPDCTEAELQRLYNQGIARAEQLTVRWLNWFGDLHAGAVVPEAAMKSAAHLRELKSAREAIIAADDKQLASMDDLPGISSPFEQSAFESAVERIKEYIAQGDVFQVNLSQRQTRAVSTTSEELYEWLRLVNPSPYMGFLRYPDFQIVSGSPELLVEMKDGLLATRPIAGTRRRGRTEEEERQFEEELRTNEKERAEHIMLVDLERNDLGRVSAYGTVEVKELMAIEYYSHVMHLVTQVEGQIATGKDAYDVIAATFPGGTITGAPKIRTMEIIEELEPVRRGPYTGSMGWIGYNGDTCFNIIIRTIAVKDGQAHVQAGAGIVIDSEPTREYRESMNKARAMWKAIHYSEQVKQRHSAT